MTVTDIYENGETKNITIPPELEERYRKAKNEAEGKILAHGSLAAMAGIGHPDEFFCQTESGIVFNDDDVLLGGAKKNAATRLGDMSVTAIIIPVGESIDPAVPVESDTAKKAEKLYYLALPITRKAELAEAIRKGLLRK